MIRESKASNTGSVIIRESFTCFNHTLFPDDELTGNREIRYSND